jgi:hypothetical protein
LGYGKSIFAEFDYSGQPNETLPVDGGKPSQFLYQVKEEVLPAVYWTRMLNGTHDMDLYRKVFAPFRGVLGAPKQESTSASA